MHKTSNQFSIKSFYVGIDPGLSGAVAMVDSDQKIVLLKLTPTVVVKKGKGKKTVYLESEMVDIIETCRNHCKNEYSISVGLENVHAMPGQGVTSMFSMGRGSGLWIGIVAALRIPYTLIEPITWKKAVGIPSGSDKRASAVRALQLFPRANLMRSTRSRVESDGLADALLIAEYTRRIASK